VVISRALEREAVARAVLATRPKVVAKVARRSRVTAEVARLPRRYTHWTPPPVVTGPGSFADSTLVLAPPPVRARVRASRRSRHWAYLLLVPAAAALAALLLRVAI
jgi:hypothetical protein